MLIAGHYEFEIIIKDLNKNSERTIYRRFSDIEWLYEGLLKYNPGCRIPNLPEKNIWANLMVNNKQLLEKRRQHIEDFLNYVGSHKYLRLNVNFQCFLSNEFDKNKNEDGNSNSLLDKFRNFSIMKKEKTLGLSVIEDNKILNDERVNLVRLKKGTSDLINNMKEYVQINEDKTEAIKNILSSSKNLQNFSLDYDSSLKHQEYDDSKFDKKISKNLEIINNFYEKNKIFYGLLSSNICDQLEVNF